MILLMIIYVIYFASYIKHIVEIIYEMKVSKPPIQTLETKIYNPIKEYDVGISNIQIVSTNSSSFENKIFKG